MNPSTAAQQRVLSATELFTNQDLTVLYMPDLRLCDFHVKSNKRFVVHFLNPATFGCEFAAIHNGKNVFDIVPGPGTGCYLFDDGQMRSAIQDIENQPSGPVKLMATIAPGPGTCTGPIIIPPTR